MALSTFCSDDYLAIYDGSNTSDPLLGKFCGSNTPPDVRSSNNNMLLVFKTDSFHIARGWKIIFRETLGKNFVYVNLLHTYNLSTLFHFFPLHLFLVAFYLRLEECHIQLWFKKLYLPFSLKCHWTNHSPTHEDDIFLYIHQQMRHEPPVVTYGNHGSWAKGQGKARLAVWFLSLKHWRVLDKFKQTLSDWTGWKSKAW